MDRFSKISLRSKLFLLVLLPLLVVQVAVYFSIHLLEEAGQSQLTGVMPKESQRHWEHLQTWKNQLLLGAVRHVWRNRELTRSLNGENGVSAQQAALNSWNQMRRQIDAFYIWQPDQKPYGVVSYGMENPSWLDHRSQLIADASKLGRAQQGVERFPDGRVRLTHVHPLFVASGRPLAFAVLGLDMHKVAQELLMMTGAASVTYTPKMTTELPLAYWNEQKSQIEIELPFKSRNGSALGGLFLERDETDLHERFHEAKDYALAMPIFISVIALLFSVLFVRWLMARFYRLTHGIEEISSHYSCQLEQPKIFKGEGDDLDLLEDHFNRMVCMISSGQKREKSQRQALEQSNAKLEQSLKLVKQAQGQLVQAEKMASLGGMVAGVAHEINTPLGIGYTGITHFHDQVAEAVKCYEAGQLTRSELTTFFAAAQESSSIIRVNLKRAAELVQSFKRVAVDQTDVHDRRFELKQYLEELLLSLKPQFKSTDVTVTLHSPQEMMLYSCPGSLSQVVSNLLLNALKHAFDESRRGGKVALTIREEGEQVVLRVEDNGVGIAAENLEKIFDPFFSTKRHDGGTGLGLHVAYNMVVQRLEGEITVESREGQGSCFTLRFPKVVSRQAEQHAEALV
uniref:histidine kinase n=1 Tax=Magnetococcus massalia (strain MO-1) TaxID=451514 RepID=A0A1S7LG62_MAGMO|nr:putative Histidine kinase [Candidatus Magnetococcus massalia]